MARRMRRFINFPCEGDMLAATIDEGANDCGLLIVSGGNEIRSGAHMGMSRLAAKLAKSGTPVLRYDRRGIGDSEGVNNEYLASGSEIMAATQFFRTQTPHLKRVVAFGNCDAAAALGLFGSNSRIDALVLANPWTLDQEQQDEDLPPPSAVRSRYLERLKNPRSLIDLVTGKIDIAKLFKGLLQASKSSKPSETSDALCKALSETDKPIHILIAKRDSTAMAFVSAYESRDYQPVRNNENVSLHKIDSSSHSFADDEAQSWLIQKIETALEA